MASFSVPITHLVDPARAYAAAIESTPSMMHSILEVFSNAKDYGSDILIQVHGTSDEKNPDEILLEKIVVTDNGCGMPHDTVCERFRGGYYDSASHLVSEKSGRNGVGVKTNFKYWKTIEVVTSTADPVPEKWTCSPDNEKGIMDSWEAITSLRPGDPDTEKRYYQMTRNSLEFKRVSACEAEEKGTIVTLKNPIGRPRLSEKGLLRCLGRSIEFLDTARHPHHRVRLEICRRDGKTNVRTVTPFYEQAKAVEDICQAVGSSNKLLLVTGVRPGASIKPIEIEPVDSKVLDPVEISLRVVEGLDSDGSEFVISICGSNIYDNLGRGTPPALAKVAAGKQMTSMAAFQNKIFGYVRTNNPKLKQALRLNRTALDDDDPVVRVFMDYLGRVVSALSHQFNRCMELDGDEEDRNALEQIREGLNLVLSSRTASSSTGKANGKPRVHEHWACLDCGCEWKVKIGSPTPLYCCDGSVEEREGCGSSRVERKRSGVSSRSGVSVEWVRYIGGFVPAIYDPETNTVKLSRMHPDFILRSQTKNARSERTNRGIERGLFAIAISQSESGGDIVQRQYAQLLKARHLKANNAAHQRACRKIWACEGIDLDKI